MTSTAYIIAITALLLTGGLAGYYFLSLTIRRRNRQRAARSVVFPGTR